MAILVEWRWSTPFLKASVKYLSGFNFNFNFWTATELYRYATKLCYNSLCLLHHIHFERRHDNGTRQCGFVLDLVSWLLGRSPLYERQSSSASWRSFSLLLKPPLQQLAWMVTTRFMSLLIFTQPKEHTLMAFKIFHIPFHYNTDVKRFLRMFSCMCDQFGKKKICTMRIVYDKKRCSIKLSGIPPSSVKNIIILFMVKVKWRKFWASVFCSALCSFDRLYVGWLQAAAMSKEDEWPGVLKRGLTTIPDKSLRSKAFPETGSWLPSGRSSSLAAQHWERLGHVFQGPSAWQRTNTCTLQWCVRWTERRESLHLVHSSPRHKVRLCTCRMQSENHCLWQNLGRGHEPTERLHPVEYNNTMRSVKPPGNITAVQLCS